MALPPSAAPRRRAPPQGRLSGRSSPRSELRRFAALVAVLAGAPVSVARPRLRPKGTTAPGKPAPCVSRASPDPGYRPSTRRTVRPRRGPCACGTRRQPSPARPAVVAYGISPRSRCGLPEPRQRGRPVHNPEPDTANQFDSFVGHVPLFPRDFSIPRAVPCKIRAGRCNRAPGQMPLAERGARAPAMAFGGHLASCPILGFRLSVRDSAKLTLDVGNHESRKIPPSPVVTPGTLIMVISVRRVNGREPPGGRRQRDHLLGVEALASKTLTDRLRHPGRREPGRPRCAVRPLQRAAPRVSFAVS